MAKLGKDMVKRVNAADDDPFAPIPKGFIKFKLTKVESGKSQSSGKNMWTWIFKAVEPVAGKEARDWSTFDSEWKFKQIFGAFGVPADTDTDDLIGKTLIAEVDHRVANQGPRKGKLQHFIAGYPDQNTKPQLFEDDEDAEDGYAVTKKPSEVKKSDESAPF